LIRVESANGVGKTYLSAGLLNWFFDSFSPSVSIVNAPTDDQINLLFWPKVKLLRKHSKTELYPKAPMMRKSDTHMAYGRVSSSEAGAKGQHHDYQLFIFEEAEGVPEHYYDAVTQMLTGSKVSIWLLIGNPESRSSQFFKKARDPNFINLRFDLLDYPNVVEGKSVIPGGTTRQWLLDRLNDNEDPCTVVESHSEADYTFELPWHMPGVIWKPSNKFLRMCRGITPPNSTGNTLVSVGVFEAATKRKEPTAKSDVLQLGYDVARNGDDYGKLYSLYKGVAKLRASFPQQDSWSYLEAGVKAILETPVGTKVSVRADGTGGFASGVIDLLKADLRLKGYELILHEVHFGSDPHDKTAYADIVTEMYGHANETLKGIRVDSRDVKLQEDLTERTYETKNKAGVFVKKLTDKDKFKKDFKRSPDDGDAFVLTIAPEFIFMQQNVIGGGFVVI
jgi:hypothetical protein